VAKPTSRRACNLAYHKTRPRHASVSRDTETSPATRRLEFACRARRYIRKTGEPREYTRASCVRVYAYVPLASHSNWIVSKKQTAICRKYFVLAPPISRADSSARSRALLAQSSPMLFHRVFHQRTMSHHSAFRLSDSSTSTRDRQRRNPNRKSEFAQRQRESTCGRVMIYSAFAIAITRVRDV